MSGCPSRLFVRQVTVTGRHMGDEPSVEIRGEVAPTSTFEIVFHPRALAVGTVIRESSVPVRDLSNG